MNGNNKPLSLELDEKTASLLVRLAKAWGVSEAEVIRRAVEQANDVPVLSNIESKMEAFKELQRSLSLTPAKAAAWQDAVSGARR